MSRPRAGAHISVNCPSEPPIPSRATPDGASFARPVGRSWHSDQPADVPLSPCLIYAPAEASPATAPTSPRSATPRAKPPERPSAWPSAAGGSRRRRSTVVVWRDHAEHAAQSLWKGSRVVLAGDEDAYRRQLHPPISGRLPGGGDRRARHQPTGT